MYGIVKCFMDQFGVEWLNYHLACELNKCNIYKQKRSLSKLRICFQFIAFQNRLVYILHICLNCL